MPLRRSPRIATVVLALVAVAAVGGSADPLGPDGQAGRRWQPAAGPAGPLLAAPARTVVLALGDHKGRRWR